MGKLIGVGFFWLGLICIVLLCSRYGTRLPERVRVALWCVVPASLLIGLALFLI